MLRPSFIFETERLRLNQRKHRKRTFVAARWQACYSDHRPLIHKVYKQTNKQFVSCLIKIAVFPLLVQQHFRIEFCVALRIWL